MKQLLLVAFLAAIAASALTFAVCETRLPAATDAPAPASRADEHLRRALADLTREISALRRDTASLAAAPTQQPAAPARGGERAVPPPDGARSPGAPLVRPGRPATLPDTASRIERFRAAVPRDQFGEIDYAARAAQRREWLIRDESEVFAWFGPPTEIDGSGELEMWNYAVATGSTLADGTPEMRRYWIRINRGRLIDLGD